MYILTVQQIRQEEERGFHSGISYETMMRTAGMGFAETLFRQHPVFRCITVVCGKGKNGGDGFVAAKQFARMNRKVYIVLAMGAPTDELSAKMYAEAKRYGITVADYTRQPDFALDLMQKADCLVDAVFGIGFRGELSVEMQVLAQAYNSMKGKKAALDIPSGLSADSRQVPDCYFHADYTGTMHACKIAHYFAPASKACGSVFTVDIGFPVYGEQLGAMCEVNEHYVKSQLPKRPLDAHKGTFGFALSVCGSYRMPGAAAFAASACVLCGAGLTAAAFPDRAYVPISCKLTEPVLIPCPSDEQGGFAEESISFLQDSIRKATAILFGCGVGTGKGSAALLEYILQTAACPVILDADGINLFAANIHIGKERKCPLLLTPHPGEMARLTGLPAAQIQENRVQTAKDFAAEHQVILLLKGSQTVIACPNGRVYINPTGNPGMATGGSGDMLSGMILSFAAQGMNLPAAACCGAYLHGCTGDEASAAASMMSTTPTGMLKMLPSVLSHYENKV